MCELRGLKHSRSESGEPGGNLNKRPVAQHKTRAEQGEQRTLGKGHPRSSKHTKSQILFSRTTPQWKEPVVLGQMAGHPWAIPGTAWCTGSGEVTLTEADLRVGPVGEPPALGLDHPRNLYWAPPCGPTWVQMIPLINDRKEINVSCRRIPHYHRGTLHKYLTDTPQNCQDHQK